MFFLRKWARPAPPPYNPHATPPAGSLGDAFDEHLRLPRRPLPGEAEEWQLQQEERLERRLRRQQPVISKPRMHPAIAAAISLLAVALVSWGPLVPVGVAAAATGAVLAAIAVYRVKVSGVWATGARRGIAIGALCLAWAITLQAFPQRVQGALDTLQRRLGARATVIGLRDHQEVLATMDLFVRLAACAVNTMGPQALTVGLTDRNGNAPTDERYGTIPTINTAALPVRALFRDANPNLRHQRELPAEDITHPLRGLEDPYSEGGRFPFPLIVRDGHAIAWSRGPDRDADLSPMHDIRPGEPETYGFLIQSSYDPTNGAFSSGDLIHWRRLDEVDCATLR